MLELWRQARVREALTIASEHGELVMASNAEELHARMVADYCAAIQAGEDAVMIAQRRADARDLNARARAWLDATGTLGPARSSSRAASSRSATASCSSSTTAALGVENGNRGRVTAIDRPAGALTVELSGGRRRRAARRLPADAEPQRGEPTHRPRLRRDRPHLPGHAPSIARSSWAPTPRTANGATSPGHARAWRRGSTCASPTPTATPPSTTPPPTARARLDAMGTLGPARVELAGGQFAVGDRIVLKLNDRRLGVENGNRGRISAIDAATGAISIELSAGRKVTLPVAYLGRRTHRGEPTVSHGYAATAHTSQGSTVDRAFVLGSDTAYREWGYVAWSRARLRTRFYSCEPDADGDTAEHHTAADESYDAFNDIARVMQRSQAQRAALDLLDHVRPVGADAQMPAGQGRDAPCGVSVASRGMRHPESLLARPAARGQLPRAVSDRTGPSPGASNGRLGVIAGRDAPVYVLIELGDRPAQPSRAAAWDGAVRAIDDYRLAQQVTDTTQALGNQPTDLAAQVAWRKARRLVDRTRRELIRTTKTRGVTGRTGRSI